MSKTGTPMPSLEGATEWFNATGARAAAEAKGHPTLVYFWSAGCDICMEHITRVAVWRDTHEELRVIAIHTPGDEGDTDTELVREAVALHKITEPCAVDNEHKLREAFQPEGGDLPAYYLYDDEGKLSSDAAGERGLSTIETALESLLAARKGGAAAS
ncbi:MAG: redoxin domain-containing protein [Acidobacteria bacterium]|nr:redoxin domain-containing protein [Acidobacteriota bacterium]